MEVLMSFPISPMTKLEAVNICLSSMGEPVVNSLDGAAIDAQMASDIIDETSRSVQGHGWHWNREKHTLSPNVANQIMLPANTLRIDSVDDSRSVDVVQRGTKLFNVGTASFTFDKEIRVEVYVQLTFEDLPFAAKQFIAMRAARILQQRLLGAESLFKFTTQDEQRAWITLMQEECEVADGNMIHDSWSTSSIVNRSYFSRGAY
jgi:hypothetical protein